MKIPWCFFLWTACVVVVDTTTTTTTNLEKAVNHVWQGMMEANAYQEPFLIHRPYSETPGDAVSEGVGYGMLIAWALNDSLTLDRLYDGADQTMWNGRFYDWRVDAHHQKVAYGAATDAEQDIAAALILVLKKMERGMWPRSRYEKYGVRARTILDQLWSQGITYQGTLRPGYGWGGDDFVNVGYFAPAWYRLFAEFQPNRDWMRVVDRSYAILEKSPGYDRGLVPDWMTPEGQWVYSGLGYNAYGDGRYLYKDAIRTLWRVGTDFLWNDDDRARLYLDKALGFLGTIQQANFFQMDGSLVPADDVWVFDGGQRQRPRREHSCLTVGMWGIPLFLRGNSSHDVISEMLTFYTPNATHWEAENNEMYFEQFLACFGALIFCGQWWM